jgi:hypothetical protein
VNLTLNTGRGVEFLWPSNNFPVLRGFAATGEEISLYYSDAGAESFRLQGNVGIQGGQLFNFERSFYLREGEIAFDESGEEFDPRVSVRAEIREVSNEGPVEIYLIAENSPLSNFSPRFESDPPLTDVEILAILGGNIFAGGDTDVLELSNALLLTSDIAFQFGIMRGIESTIREALNLDLFSVRSSLFQNLVRGVIDEPADPLDNVSPSLGQYLDNTTVFVGRYLGTDLFLEALVQLRSSNPFESNLGALGGLEVESEISLDFETPLFLLEWNFFPRNPEDLFVTDNSFTFSWEFSY